jgi:hypothetical protein
MLEPQQGSDRAEVGRALDWFLSLLERGEWERRKEAIKVYLTDAKVLKTHLRRTTGQA